MKPWERARRIARGVSIVVLGIVMICGKPDQSRFMAIVGDFIGAGSFAIACWYFADLCGIHKEFVEAVKATIIWARQCAELLGPFLAGAAVVNLLPGWWDLLAIPCTILFFKVAMGPEELYDVPNSE